MWKMMRQILLSIFHVNKQIIIYVAHVEVDEANEALRIPGK